jgi:hypothetical protein
MAYVGQSVVCEPETLPDGTMSADYCGVEAAEIVGSAVLRRPRATATWH